MSKRIFELFLFDIYIAILKIEFISSKFDNSETLKYDFISWDSVIREFEIIGEATNILIKNAMLEKENQIVVDFRNLLIHHYFGIDSEEVWDVIHNDLKVYKKLIISKIHTIEEELKSELINDISSENKHIEFIVEALKQMM
ncbi:HepT-like ribonuclease domain-containing protein [Sulfurimonas sp.]|uniref:HepT-like ribonuclease domain-containing protein n=1 Tax=Sulfurimonas sp. TaxID=2022749 RepID=UPI003D13886E